MPQRVKTDPRKAPTQSRAQDTVEAILAATARVLVRDGYDRASTNRIAEAAGVSIGSLYQYFPSKEALASTLIERHMQKMLGVLMESYQNTGANATIADSARTIIHAVFAAHRVNPKLHRVLIEQVPRVGTLDRMDAFEEQTQALVESYLAAHAHETRRKNVRLAARTALLAVRGTTLYTVMRAPDMLDDEAFIDEVVDMITRYLTRAE